MTIERFPVSPSTIEIYSRIPIAFWVDAILAVEPGPRVDDQRFTVAAHPVPTPYLKDYDEHAEGPVHWGARFDTSRWQLLVARRAGVLVGGATVACQSPQFDLLEERTDLAVLWDLRVRPTFRRQGIGAALFMAAEAWALGKGCRELKVETQNINVAACAFYAQRGCCLRAAHHGVYTAYPEEIQLLWYKTLMPERMGPPA